MAIAALVVLGWTQRHRFEPVAIGSMAPSYEAPTVDGSRAISLESLRGKVVLLNIWATWCPPCIREMPAIESAYRQLKSEGLEVLAVSVDAPVGKRDAMGNLGGDIQEFAQQFSLTFPILHDPEKRVEQKFAIFGLPTTIVIDRDGRIAQKVIGGAEWDDAEHMASLRELLRQK